MLWIDCLLDGILEGALSRCFYGSAHDQVTTMTLTGLLLKLRNVNIWGLQCLTQTSNESYQDFAVVPGKNKIRFGMAVKGVGVGSAKRLFRHDRREVFEC